MSAIATWEITNVHFPQVRTSALFQHETNSLVCAAGRHIVYVNITNKDARMKQNRLEILSNVINPFCSVLI